MVFAFLNKFILHLTRKLYIHQFSVQKNQSITLLSSFNVDYRFGMEEDRIQEDLKRSISDAAMTKGWTVVPKAPVRIGDKVWIGFNVIILKRVTIGEGTVIAAGSVGTKNVPAWALAGGNPVRVIKQLDLQDDSSKR